MAVRSKTIKGVKGGGGCALLIGQNDFTGSSITSLKNCGKQTKGRFFLSHTNAAWAFYPASLKNKKNAYLIYKDSIRLWLKKEKLENKKYFF